MKLNFLLLLLSIINNSQSAQSVVIYTALEQIRPNIVFIPGIGLFNTATGEAESYSVSEDAQEKK